ncbi:MAG TPA: response regulator [Methylomirabilota bacterium]|jgi:FixJ family two-component response regulator|nr:response regulator [Methylomirabilota bacterium]
MIRQRPLIAVVDDEESVRKSLRRLLVASELDATVYASGQEFLDSLGGHQPDCLVLDLQMPGLTGLEVQRALARARVRFPTIIITAHDEPETRARCLAAGAVAYLCKPLHDELLLDAITTAVGPIVDSVAAQKRPDP